MVKPLVHVVIVEDHLPTQQRICHMLERQGFQVSPFRDGASGLQFAQSSPPHLVITDLDLPGMHGFQLMAALRSMPATCEVPILVCSGTQDALSRRLAQSYGIMGYVHKPFSDGQLLQMVSQTLEGQSVSPAGLRV
ncbi:response regulator [Lyngbya confervoides]|uniref:Response regulator n=1 Tax=Lyngbya confervoides BDU141951 TaxID=1574623 RepID=A0ABD4T436_9CYAN|nr:response regulator [Lyngbya confervoides]MCM1983431.1 response regulator [Lyngbya confervoides BDU141951]